jgi:RimJ/RimL family protein N-acetyltransferase
VTVRPLEAAADADSLYAVSHPPAGDPALWTYLSYGPFGSPQEMRAALDRKEHSDDPLFFSIVPSQSERAAGVASYLRIEPGHGVIEIGHIWFGAPLRHTTAATEAIFLLAAHAFDDLGYRRFEWNCNALNAASRSAAERFGFTFEGVFRNHMVVKGRNRDTAWYSIVSSEWPAIRDGFREWLAPANFDENGRQRRPLGVSRARGGNRCSSRNRDERFRPI